MSKRIVPALVAAALLLSACGGGSTSGSAGTSATTSTISTSTTTGGSSGIRPAGTAGSASYPVTLTSGGHTTTIAKKPTRVVSLSPTATEDLFAIGAGAQVVAVDDQSTYPPVAPKTKLSGFKPNAESVLGYKPDLVVIANDANGLVAALDAAKVPVLEVPAATSLKGVYQEITNLGSATAHSGPAATVATSVRSAIAEAVAETPKSATKLTYYHELSSDYYTSTSATFIGSIYALFGLKNIADAAAKGGNQYPQLSSEYVLKANPDLIFLADVNCCQQSAASVAKRPGWSALKAVKGKGVVGLDDDVASRWGPRVVTLAQSVSAAIKARSGKAGSGK